MPALRQTALVDAVLRAIEDSGYSGILVSPVNKHPREFVVRVQDDATCTLWLYVWNLTPGGRPSLPNEYRIQMTTVQSPLQTHPVGPTLLMGYEPDRGVFAGFDLARHRTFTIGSPSVQIDIRTVRQALQDGLAFSRKSNEEVAIGVRSDQFMAYALNAEQLHRLGRFTKTLKLLNQASSLEPIPELDLSKISAPRRRVVQTVSRLSRHANFRQQILNAYSNRCAVTGLQLRLVEAAHILPVGAPGSVDDVRNGLALSPTYHRAYDQGLIYLDAHYTMKVNPHRVDDLRRLRLDAGLNPFRASLSSILLPPDRRQWPDPRFIRKANRFRRVG